MVVEDLVARDEPFALGGSEEEAATLPVGEELDGEAREAQRLVEVPPFAGGDVELVEAVRDIGVVLEERGRLRLAGAKGAEEPSLGV